MTENTQVSDETMTSSKVSKIALLTKSCGNNLLPGKLSVLSLFLFRTI